MYLNGKGVNKDQDEAIKWLRKASEQEYEKAKKMLKEIGC